MRHWQDIADLCAELNRLAHEGKTVHVLYNGCIGLKGKVEPLYPDDKYCGEYAVGELVVDLYSEDVDAEFDTDGTLVVWNYEPHPCKLVDKEVDLYYGTLHERGVFKPDGQGWYKVNNVHVQAYAINQALTTVNCVYVP